MMLLLASLLMAPAALPAEHAVILIIDGLSYKAVDRLDLKNLRNLIANGTYYEKSYNILPADPRSGEWTRYHSSSIPNPVILAGTVLLRSDQRYVQECFYPDRITAHAANDIAYRRINMGFHLSFLKGSDEKPTHDDETMHWALAFLRKERPAFMKIHLQDTGSAGYLCYQEKNPATPWRHNIWAEGSPYLTAALRADEYLGRFLDELGKLGMRGKTVLFVTSDHGQADKGWHPSDDPEAWPMPLVVSGPGVRAGQRFDYAEQIDIVPTLCHLMNVKPPANSDGRILAEALLSAPADVPPRRQRIKELNALILEGDALLNELRTKAKSSPALKEKLADTERDYYGLDRILEWNRFGTVDKLMAHNRAVLKELSGPTHTGR
ncbi:MAG: sulfatase-like hydrolase/transferase [Acidobacteriales bacterium]|nr:sulfatase-like hydrolase/transferase [Terriglobales bacterium]